MSTLYTCPTCGNGVERRDVAPAVIRRIRKAVDQPSADAIAGLQQAISYYEMCFTTLGDDFEDRPRNRAERSRMTRRHKAALAWLHSIPLH